MRDRVRIYSTVQTPTAGHGHKGQAYGASLTWQNGFAEPLIGSIRRECVDHLIVLGEAHLRRILRAYARYYSDKPERQSLVLGACCKDLSLDLSTRKIFAAFIRGTNTVIRMHVHVGTTRS